jgi:hypothetical protein
VLDGVNLHYAIRAWADDQINVGVIAEVVVMDIPT